MNFLKSSFVNPLHVVSASPWPFVASLMAFSLTGGLVLWWSKFIMSFPFYVFILLLFLMVFWWSDVSFESSQGEHSFKVFNFFRVGMLLFILSEVLFFFSFFWAFFHNCLATTLDMGNDWPPYNFLKMMIDPFSVPLLKTVLLLSSGMTMTSSHHFMMMNKKTKSSMMLFFTLTLGVMFLSFQLFEYSSSYLGMNSSTYGSSFYILTGFHGLHVIIGSMMLLVSFLRLFFYYYSKSVHLVFELSAWYWHFVDVVWLFLYFFLYWFGFLLTQV